MSTQGDGTGPATFLPPEVCIASRDPSLKWGDRYILVEQIGEGGLGTVWKAWDRHLEKFVAIKRIRGEFDTQEAAAFMAEGRIVARLHHPNIATVFDIGIHENEPYIVMQLVEGETLNQSRAWAPHRLAATLKDVTRALEFSHRHGVLHQDLKPENLMIVKPPGEQERVVVLDFAISRILGGSKKLAGRVGTPGFMSPEQASGAEVDARSDIYALGVTFRSLLPTQSLPREVKGVISRCVAVQPAERFATMTEMENALERVAAHPRRLKRAAALLATAVLLVIGSTIYVLAPIVREKNHEKERFTALERAQGFMEAGQLNEAFAEVVKAGPVGRELRKQILLRLNGYETTWEQKLHGGGVVGVGFLKGGAHVVSGGRDSMVRIWESSTGTPLTSYRAHSGRITAMDISPDGAFIATSGEEKTIKIWRGESGECTAEWSEESAVHDVQFSPDGRNLAIGKDDGSVQVRPVSGGPPRDYPGSKSPARTIAFSRDGALLAAGRDDGMVHVWRLSEGGTPAPFPNSVGWIWDVAFTRDGSKVIAAYSANFLRAFDLATKNRTSEWMGHTGAVMRVIPQAGDAIAVTAAQDSTIRLWSMTDRKAIAVLPRHPDEVLSMAMHGDRIAAGCLDGTVRISDRRWVFGEVPGFSREGGVVDIQADGSGRLWVARVVDGVLRMESESGPPERIMNFSFPGSGAFLHFGPESSAALVITRLDSSVMPPPNVVEFAIRQDGAWTLETVNRDQAGWSSTGVWGNDGSFHLIYGHAKEKPWSLVHSTRSRDGSWAHRELGTFPEGGYRASLHMGASGLEILRVLFDPFSAQSIRLEGTLDDLNTPGAAAPEKMKMWKDRTGRMHGIGLYSGDILVFSQNSGSGHWRRINTDGEKVAAVTGWSPEDGSLEIRWVIEGSNRIKSARLPAN